MPPFRKRPIEIEARRVDSESIEAIAEWCAGYVIGTDIHLKTREGVMRARQGDWVVRGVHGEFYPVKPEIFTETYEEI